MRRVALVLILVVVFFWALASYGILANLSPAASIQKYQRLKQAWAWVSVFSVMLILLFTIWASISSEQRKTPSVDPELLRLLSQRGALMSKILQEIIDRLESPAFVLSGEKVLFKNRAAQQLPSLSIPVLARRFEIEKVELSMGESIATLYILKDTEKIKEEVKREEERKRLISLGELASFLSHEVKNSLSVILALLKTGKTREIKGEVEELSRMVDQFLREARPVNPVLQNLTLNEEFFSRWRVQVRGTARVKADPYILQLIMDNLVKNSLQAGASRITLSIKEEGRFALLEYRDNGEGIDESEKDSIFLPFYSRRKGGTGLGLSFAKKALLAMGGDIWAEPSEGGAKFLIKIPLS